MRQTAGDERDSSTRRSGAGCGRLRVAPAFAQPHFQARLPSDAVGSPIRGTKKFIRDRHFGSPGFLTEAGYDLCGAPHRCPGKAARWP